MPKRTISGPAATVASVGAVLALLGVLVLFAVPAAKQLDVRVAQHNDEKPGTVRQHKIEVSGTVLIVLGLGMVGTGWLMERRRGRKGRK
ncbi:MAG TPA: hypothetical protein VNI20_02650 [Fimbriimonadaceae bacterium]|nr:hypothetical protein [Fimbriimonadaceae bacterium]